MNDASLKAAMVGMTPEAEMKDLEPAVGSEPRRLNPTDELALARKMGSSPEQYQAVTGRAYPLAQQQAQSDQSAAAPGAVEKPTYADLLKQELARQPNIGINEPISAMDRAKLRASALVGDLSTDRDKERRAVRRTKRNG